MLRQWQVECVDSALAAYSNQKKHYLCLATPGAGKTIMAAEVAARLKQQGLIDLILCFSPSLVIAESIQMTFSNRLGCTFNGGIGSIGGSYTYQNMLFMKDDFWKAVNQHRVLVVFDEIHHCAGTSLDDANAWGLEILTKMQQQAVYTLALTGTPWRSDTTPIVLASYSNPDGLIECDYTYGLRQAIEDKVCRSPKIVLVDNDQLTVNKSNNETATFRSIAELLSNELIPYQAIISNPEAMRHVLKLGCQKLQQIRAKNPMAGGLVVASSVEHATEILEILRSEFNQTVVIVTYRHDEPLTEIAAFRTGDVQWIVSVGMISEGTDIPRLQVCCHLSAVKTELYFRQVLGRILRISNAINQEAWLYTFAETNLNEFAERIAIDIPETNVIQRVRSEINGDLFVERDLVIEPETHIEATRVGRNCGFLMLDNLEWNSASKSNHINVKITSTLSKKLSFDNLYISTNFRERLIDSFGMF